MVDFAVAVAQNLHLDMARLQDHLFQIAFAIAKGCFCLAPAFHHFFFKLFFIRDGAHAATPAAPGRLEHQRVANLCRLLADDLNIIA